MKSPKQLQPLLKCKVDGFSNNISWNVSIVVKIFHKGSNILTLGPWKVVYIHHFTIETKGMNQLTYWQLHPLIKLVVTYPHKLYVCLCTEIFDPTQPHTGSQTTKPLPCGSLDYHCFYKTERTVRKHIQNVLKDVISHQLHNLFLPFLYIVILINGSCHICSTSE